MPGGGGGYGAPGGGGPGYPYGGMYPGGIMPGGGGGKPGDPGPGAAENWNAVDACPSGPVGGSVGRPT